MVCSDAVPVRLWGYAAAEPSCRSQSALDAATSLGWGTNATTQHLETRCLQKSLLA